MLTQATGKLFVFCMKLTCESTGIDEANKSTRGAETSVPLSDGMPPTEALPLPNGGNNDDSDEPQLLPPWMCPMRLVDADDSDGMPAGADTDRWRIIDSPRSSMTACSARDGIVVAGGVEPDRGGCRPVSNGLFIP